MFRIRGEEGNREYSGAAVQQRLRTCYVGQHVAVEHTKASGIIVSHFITVSDEGHIRQTYGKARAVNFVRLEVEEGTQAA